VGVAGVTCADFLAGATLDSGDPDILLRSAVRFFTFLPGEYKRLFLDYVAEIAAR
jgi:hypothetical protein